MNRQNEKEKATNSNNIIKRKFLVKLQLYELVEEQTVYMYN